MRFESVASTSELARGKTLCVVVGDTEVLLCHTPEGIFAVDNLCTHAAEKLQEGRLKGCRLHCPLHGAAFDVRDGSALSRPATQPLPTYPVRIEGDAIQVGIES